MMMPYRARAYVLRFCHLLQFYYMPLHDKHCLTFAVRDVLIGSERTHCFASPNRCWRARCCMPTTFGICWKTGGKTLHGSSATRVTDGATFDTPHYLSGYTYLRWFAVRHFCSDWGEGCLYAFSDCRPDLLLEEHHTTRMHTCRTLQLFGK